VESSIARAEEIVMKIATIAPDDTPWSELLKRYAKAVGGVAWDIAGATWFGFTTFWLNRQNAPLEELGVTPHGTGAGMNDLLAFVNTLASAGDAPRPSRATAASRTRRPRSSGGA